MFISQVNNKSDHILNLYIGSYNYKRYAYYAGIDRLTCEFKVQISLITFRELLLIMYHPKHPKLIHDD